MKKIVKMVSLSILAASMGCSAQATDWTPVFSQWRDGCAVWNDELKAQEPVLYAIQYATTAGEMATAKLPDTAKAGNYQGVPQPYRDDLLPAYAAKSYADDKYQRFIIPLKNATFAGILITSYSMEQAGERFEYDINNAAVFRRSVNFGQINKDEAYRILTTFGDIDDWEDVTEGKVDWEEVSPESGGLSLYFAKNRSMLMLESNENNDVIITCQWASPNAG